MGDEIQHSHFTENDFVRFKQELDKETRQLSELFTRQGFDDRPPVSGFEIEAWLVDSDFRPAALNEQFLHEFNNPLASPELASFNIEVNTEPRNIHGHVFSAMHQSLNDTWQACHATANRIGTKVVMCGILPTVQNEDLTLANMSQMKRYRALNREVLHRRRGKPMKLDINGNEHLKLTHRDVMLESAATSFQLHIQVTQQQAARFYNASMIVSAPLLALTANSPYLFGKDLWDETRIPLFEQAVAIGGYDGAAFGPIHRVTFGTGYVKDSLFECFRENMEHYPVLLPVELDSSKNPFAHLRLHNGTIWRWNRPLIGFDETGKIHLRIEQRVVPAGPSTIDAIANAAFYYGLVYSLATADTIPESKIAFTDTRDNFYHAAHLGLRAQLKWLDGKQHQAHELLINKLLPMATVGLEKLDISKTDIKDYLGVICDRLIAKMNGTNWQRAFVKKHGRDMLALTESYYTQQNSGNPVHEWQV